MNKADAYKLAEDALDAACLTIQRAMGVTDGGFAAIFFSGDRGFAMRRLFVDYIRAERQQALQEEKA